MNRTRAYAALAFALAVALPCSARAFTPTLTQRQVRSAISEGRTLFQKGLGYQAPHHVLFARRNTLHIARGEGPVEAIIVGTPYERLKFASYLSTFEGRPMRLPEALSIVREDRGVLQLIVFTHSNGAQDRNFLTRVSNGTLQLAGHVIAALEPPSVFGPALDYYDVDGAGRQFRWLGSVTFRFNLSRFDQHGTNLENTSGTFSFVDSQGMVRRYHIDLKRYQ
jgi:hypothetical protein